MMDVTEIRQHVARLGGVRAAARVADVHEHRLARCVRGEGLITEEDVERLRSAEFTSAMSGTEMAAVIHVLGGSRSAGLYLRRSAKTLQTYAAGLRPVPEDVAKLARELMVTRPASLRRRAAPV